MPSVNIREIDKTESEPVSFDDHVVLVAGPSSDNSAGLGLFLEPILYDDIKKFEEDQKEKSTTTTPAEGETPEVKTLSQAYILVTMLLGMGFKVLYAPSYLKQDYVKYDFWERFTDKGKYDIRFILGVPEETKEQAQKISGFILTVSAIRGDSVALVDITETEAKTLEGITEFITDGIILPEDYASTGTIIRPEFEKGEEPISENIFKYGTAFAPWFTVKNPLDPESEINIPGSIHYLSCFGKHKSSFPDWFAFAGATRGVSPLVGAVPTAKFGDIEINKLQQRTADATAPHKAVNVIAEIRPYGNIMWGNRTLYPIGIEGHTGLVASSFLNIRHLSIDIKKALYRASRRFTFEPNSDVLWINFIGAIKPLLERMKSSQGIKGYQITKQKSKQKATLKATIRIIPIEAVEDFNLTVELADSIVTVEEGE